MSQQNKAIKLNIHDYLYDICASYLESCSVHYPLGVCLYVVQLYNQMTFMTTTISCMNYDLDIK